MTPGGFPGSGRVGQDEPLMFLFVFKLLSDSWLAAFVIVIWVATICFEVHGDVSP